MNRLLAKLLLTAAVIGAFIGIPVTFAAVLQGYQGGTGYGPTASSTCLNEYLQFSSTTPFVTYVCAPASGGSGSGIQSSTPFTQGFIPVITSSGALTNSNVFQSTSTGYVGIGTTAPGSPFTVMVTSTNAQIELDSGSSSQFEELFLKDTASGTNAQIFHGNANYNSFGGPGSLNILDQSGPIVFYPNGGTAVLTIQTSSVVKINSNLLEDASGNKYVTSTVAGQGTLASTTNWVSGNIAVVSSSNLVASYPASSTAVIYVDGNRTDSYTANGSFLFPQTTMSAAITQCNGLVTAGYTACVFYLSPHTYVDGAPDTFPNVPFYISGNESTLVEPSGVTMPNAFDIYDLTIVGNVTEADTSTVVIHQFNNGTIVGNITLAGLATFSGMTMPVTTSTLTATAGSNVNIDGSALYGTESGNGKLMSFADDFISASSSNCAITIASGSVTFSGVSIINMGSGCGLNANDGATSTPNVINSISVTVNSSTAGSTINTGNAATVLQNVNGLTNLQGTYIAPSGTAFVATYDEQRAVLNAFSVGTSTVTSGNTILNNTVVLPQLAVNSFLATNSGGQLITTTTPSGGGGTGSGNLFVSPTSSVLANNEVVYATNGSSTVKATSSLFNFNDGDLSNNTSTENGYINLVTPAGIPIVRASTSTVTTGSATLSVGGASTTAINGFSVFQILGDGHINSTGTIPTVSSCGLGASVIGTDAAGTISTGSGSVTACTLAFQVPYESNNVGCVESDTSNALTSDITSITTTSVTFGFSSSLASGKIWYTCWENM